jgi:hypothetical protein
LSSDDTTDERPRGPLEVNGTCVVRSSLRRTALPNLPRDLLNHRCINFRHGSQGVYRWEFDKGKQSRTVAVKGPLIVDDVELLIRAALSALIETLRP